MWTSFAQTRLLAPAHTPAYTNTAHTSSVSIFQPRPLHNHPSLPSPALPPLPLPRPPTSRTHCHQTSADSLPCCLPPIKPPRGYACMQDDHARKKGTRNRSRQWCMKLQRQPLNMAAAGACEQCSHHNNDLHMHKQQQQQQQPRTAP